ncbi:hypothetical protein R84B8_00016 [Treponema sp. R8-4-B8]
MNNMKSNLLKLRSILAIIAITALIGFFMTACNSMPQGAEESKLAPDASSAVIYFIQPPVSSGAGDIVIWDGENPIGKIYGGLYRNVAYKAKPGTHYFMANRFNWSSLKLDVKANNAYYIKLNWTPNPIPYSNAFVILELLSRQEGQEMLKKNENNIAFTEDWRKEFKSSLSKDELAELRDNLNSARKK